MNEPDTSAYQSQEVRVGRVLNDYLDRRARGEAVSKDDFIAAHPDLADELRQHFATLGELQSADHHIDGLIAQGVLTRSTDPEYLAELGPYRVTGYLGRGGMGIVLKAYEPSLNRTVALKILRPDLADDQTALERFTREAKAAAALRHPNIVTVHAVGTEPGTHYIAMEYIAGPSLADVIREEGPPDVATTRRIFRELLEGLAAAHDAGLIHRDIKSSNILLDGPDRRVKIADFGLARMQTAQTRLTQPDSAMGTAEYMSPEQARGDEQIDHRADLYSAGVVLYELLTARTPFKAASPSAVIHRILHEDPPDPRKLATAAEPHLATLALRLMAKRPEDRFPATDDALVALHADERILSLAARRRLRRRLSVAATCLLAITAAALLAWHFALRRSPIAAVRIDPDLPSALQARYGDDPEWNVFYKSPNSIDLADALLVNSGVVENETVVVASRGFFDDKHSVLLALRRNRTEVWRQRLASPLDDRWPGCATATDYRPMQLTQGEFDASPGVEIAVLANDRDEYPALISIIDPRDGKISATFWHFGQFRRIMALHDYFADGRSAILAWGVNNKLDGFDEAQSSDHKALTAYGEVPVVAILDPLLMDGLGPPGLEQAPIKLARPTAYAFIDLLAGRADDPAWSRTYRPKPLAWEFANIREVSIEAESSPGAARPCLRVETAQGVHLIVDRDLTLREVDVLNAPPESSDPALWKERWRPLIRWGSYCEAREEK